MKKRSILLIAAAFAVAINCQGQSNNSFYDDESWRYFDKISENLNNNHKASENQVWDYLFKVNDLIKQGDYDNADLLVDRCIQLNTQWQYHLIDHNTLLKKKQEIANARGNGSSPNNYSGTYYQDNVQPLSIYELVNLHRNGTNRIPDFLARYGFQYGFTNEQNTVFYYNGQDGVNGTLSFDDKTMTYFIPASVKNKVMSELQAFANYAENSTNQIGECEVYVFTNYCFFVPLKTSTIRNMQFYIMSIYKTKGNANNQNTDNHSNASSSSNDVDALYKKAFNSYLQSAYVAYDNGQYQSARQSLNDAYRIYEQQKLSLTQEESDRYNRLNDLLKSKESNNQANNSQQGDEQNMFDDVQQLNRLYVNDVMLLDSLNKQINRQGISNNEWNRLKNEIKKTEQTAEFHKREYHKAFNAVDNLCNEMLSSNKGNRAITYETLGWLYDNKGVILDTESYFLHDRDKEAYDNKLNELFACLMKAQSYCEKSYELNNTSILGKLFRIRKSLGLDEYYPSFKISPSDFVIKYPDYKELADDNIVIKRIILSDNQTIVEFSITNKKNGTYFLWMNINKNTYININGTKYNLINAEGISIAPSKTYFYSEGQAKEFALYFPPIPKNTKTIDLIEPDGSNWIFYNIQLK